MKKRKIALAALVSTLCCGSLLTGPASTYIAAQEETSMAEEPADQSTFFEAEEHQEETAEESSFEEVEKENGLPKSQKNRVFDESWMNKVGEESEIPDLHQPEASDHRLPELSIEPDLILSTESAATFDTSARYIRDRRNEQSKNRLCWANRSQAEQPEKHLPAGVVLEPYMERTTRFAEHFRVACHVPHEHRFNNQTRYCFIQSLHHPWLEQRERMEESRKEWRYDLQ